MELVLAGVGRTGQDWADRPEDAADAVQDGEGLLEALHDAQPNQEVLRMAYRALVRALQDGQ